MREKIIVSIEILWRIIEWMVLTVVGQPKALLKLCTEVCLFQMGQDIRLDN